MSDRPTPSTAGIIGGQYHVDITRPLPDAGGGIVTFAATSSRPGAAPAMALLVDRFAPARPRTLQSVNFKGEGFLAPIAQGLGPPIDGRPAWFIICPEPPGPSMSASLRPWPERMLIDQVLKPIAEVLEQFQSRAMTHRAIRPNNVFHGPAGRVTLGTACAAPPAMHQPAIYETPYTSVCHPSARGDGRIADNVYALGVLLVTLALGHEPMEGLDDKAVMIRKLEVGDYNAIVGNERLPPLLGDIVRAMLAEDPDHRPSPALLQDPASARGRRVTARPPRQAQRSFKLGSLTVWNSRSLAMAMALEPVEAPAAIHSGTMMYWLRRALGDAALAVKLEELVRQDAQDVMTDKTVAQAMLVMRAIADADIFMPLCWRGLAVFPSGLGPALATNQEKDPDLHRKLVEIVQTEAQGTWAGIRAERMPEVPQRLEARQRRAILQIKGLAGGLPRLAYTLNPQMPCTSPLLDGYWIANARDLPAALDNVATASLDAELLEPRIAAFIGARSERQLDQEVNALAGEGDGSGRILTQLRLLSEMQTRYHPAPLTGLAAWVAARSRPLVERWQNRERRAAVEARLKTLVTEGLLNPILELMEDQDGHKADSDGLRSALGELARLDGELLAITGGGGGRAIQAARIGQEIAAGIGLAALALTLILAAFG